MNQEKLLVDSPRSNSLAVWEFTLACNLKCRHCGSSAGQARKDELTTEQALELVLQLKDIGVKEINLIGGEATLRKDWQVVGKFIAESGIKLAFQTGGLHINKTIIDQMVDIGTTALGVSIDGVGSTHDDQRGVNGSYVSALRSLELASESKIPVIACTTQINRKSYKSLLKLLERVSMTRVKSWQIAQTLPMGVGTSATDLHLKPSDFFAIHELAAVFAVEAWKHGILGIAANPLGYFGPYEKLIRTGPHNRNAFYSSCPAGKGVIGIEADGTIKGCPSLPTHPYSLGKSTEGGLINLQDLWTENGNASYQPILSGFCASCPFAMHCWSGCGWSATTTMGAKGDNPYCMFRSIVHRATSKHEQLRQISQGLMGPFDYGHNEITLHEGLDPDSISVDDVQVPQSMEASYHAFKDKRSDVLAITKEVFALNSIAAKPADRAITATALDVMEHVSLPNDYLKSIGLMVRNG